MTAARVGDPASPHAAVISAGTAKDADRLLAHDVNHKILPGHVLRFASVFDRLRARVRAGAIGQVLGVSARRDCERGHVQRYGHTHPAFLTPIHAWVLPADAPPADRFKVYGTDGVASVDVTGDRVTFAITDAGPSGSAELRGAPIEIGR